MTAPETFESLWDYCTANRRLVPAPQRWNEMYGMLAGTRELPSGGWEPPLPLILAAWYETMPIEKPFRFKEHVQWASDHGQIAEVGRYLRSLRETD
jgi:hypothetical protein